MILLYIFQNTTSPKNPTAKLLSQPSISITPLPRTTSQTSVPGSGTSSKSGGKTTFVICEICDGYIKVNYVSYSRKSTVTCNLYLLSVI